MYKNPHYEIKQFHPIFLMGILVIIKRSPCVNTSITFLWALISCIKLQYSTKSAQWQLGHRKVVWDIGCDLSGDAGSVLNVAVEIILEITPYLSCVRQTCRNQTCLIVNCYRICMHNSQKTFSIAVSLSLSPSFVTTIISAGWMLPSCYLSQCSRLSCAYTRTYASLFISHIPYKIHYVYLCFIVHKK